jgi:hypothetical protein
MKKFLFAALMLVGFAGISMAQTAPVTATHSKTHVKSMHKHPGKHKAHHHKKAAAAVK